MNGTEFTVDDWIFPLVGSQRKLTSLANELACDHGLSDALHRQGLHVVTCGSHAPGPEAAPHADCSVPSDGSGDNELIELKGESTEEERSAEEEQRSSNCEQRQERGQSE